MDQVVAEAGLPWLETPDQVVVWGTALGLHGEIEEVLDRSLEDQREGRVAAGSVWIPAWYSPAPAVARGFASGDFAGAGERQRRALLELGGPEPRRNDGGARDDRELAVVVRVERRWRRLRRRRIRRRWRRLGRRVLADHAAVASRAALATPSAVAARPGRRPAVRRRPARCGGRSRSGSGAHGRSGGSAAGTGHGVIGTSIRKSSRRRLLERVRVERRGAARGDRQGSVLRERQRDHRAEHRLRRRHLGREAQRGADRVAGLERKVVVAGHHCRPAAVEQPADVASASGTLSHGVGSSVPCQSNSARYRSGARRPDRRIRAVGDRRRPDALLAIGPDVEEPRALRRADPLVQVSCVPRGADRGRGRAAACPGRAPRRRTSRCRARRARRRSGRPAGQTPSGS